MVQPGKAQDVSTKTVQPPPVGSDSQSIAVTSVRFTGNSIYSSAILEELVASIIGKASSLNDLRVATSAITVRYRQAGYFLARAYIPPQAIKDGVITIAISEGKLADIRLENTSRIPNSRVEAFLSNVKAGEPVNRVPIDRALFLLQDLPGIAQADSRFTPGKETGTTTLVASTNPSQLLTGRLEADNYGSQFTGRYRLTASGDINSPLGFGERFSARVMYSDEDLNSGRLAGQVPLGRNGLTVISSLNHTQYALGDSFANLDAVGKSTSGDVSLRYPIIRSATVNLYAQGGVEHRKLVDELRSFSVRTEKHATLGTASITTDWRDGLGGGGATQGSVTVSQGHLGIDSADAAALDELGAQTQGNYSKLTWNIERQQALFNRLSLGLSWRGQYASKNLDTSEKFFLGGASGVRAYPSGEGSGDHGWLASAELRYQFTSKVMGSVFYDEGQIKVNANPFLTTPNERRLSGVGFEVSGAISSFDWRLTAAWRRTAAPVSEGDRHPRVWAQMGWRF